MEVNAATDAFFALSQPTRLQAIRLLVRHGHDGLAAGELAQALAVPANTLSGHLGVLARAGLVASTREGRSIRYTAELGVIRDLVGFLVEDCCLSTATDCSATLDRLLPTCVGGEPDVAP